jgi:hypothetical protein
MLAAAVGSQLPASRGTVSEMDEQVRRLIKRAAAVLDQDDVAANRLIEDELEPFIERARSDVTTGEALLAMLRERMATRAIAPPPPVGNGGEKTVNLDDHRAKFLETTARDGALLVLLEGGPMRLKPLRHRMEELGHLRISNLSPALYKAAKHTTPPLVTHGEDGIYELTAEGRDFANQLLKP